MGVSVYAPSRCCWPALGALALRPHRGRDHQFIHTATLLHDDVVDSSGLRRGQQTANAVFGNQASVLVGDFLYSRAFQMMVELKELRILDVMANATNTIAEGEVLQLMNCNNPDITEADYMEVIYRKTAKLFEAGTRIGAILAQQNDDIEQALVSYGRHLGQAFQLVDDALDYDAKPEELGKNIGDDLADGKPTLPLIYAMNNGSAAERHLIREAIESGSTQNLRSIQLAIETSGGLRYTPESREEVEVATALDRCRPRSSTTADDRAVRHPAALLAPVTACPWPARLP
jgi:octaprenyl-diphosphate synthase